MWQVTYRDENGNRATCEMDAESRDALFAALAEKHITPLSVTETAGSARPKRASANRPSPVRGLLAGLLVVVLAAGVSFFIFRRDGRTQKIDKLPESKPTIPAVAPAATNAPVAAPAAEEKPAEPPKRLYKGVEVKSSTLTTNALDGAIVEKLVLADGRRIKTVQLPKPLFEHPSDQLIAMAVSVEPGQDMPPMPLHAGIEESFAKSLLDPIRIKDNDPEDVKDLKAKVIEARAYIAQEIKSGKTVREVLEDYQATMHDIADSHLFAVREMQKIREEYGEEEARTYAERVNESFRARGIPELNLPPAKKVRPEQATEQKDDAPAEDAETLDETENEGNNANDKDEEEAE